MKRKPNRFINLPYRLARHLHLAIALIASLSAWGQSGELVESGFVHGGVTRNYTLYIPNSYSGDEAWPLVVSYHGYTGDMTQQIELTTMNVVADTTDYLVVYPQGLTVTRRTNDGLPSFLPASGAGWSLPTTLADHDDLAFTRELVTRLRGSYQIDSTRIHAVGISMGAIMAWQVSCELSDVFASVAGVAAPPTFGILDSCSADRVMSRLLIQGTGDGIIPFDGVADVFPSASAAIEFMASEASCHPESTSFDLPDIDTGDESSVTLFSYIDCNEDIELLLYRINNGGHGWPGPGGHILPASLGPVNHDIDAAVEILNFFNRNPMATPVVSVDSNTGPQIDRPSLITSYPNPFNPMTVIQFTLPAADQVSLKIFDLGGRLVKSFGSVSLPGGEHAFTWNGQDAAGRPVSAGIYLGVMTTGGYQQTVKMNLVK